jgi:hypothetical protein
MLFGLTRLYCVWVFVLRILFGLFGIGFLCSISTVASAACGPEALGTSRTIVIDPSKGRSFFGRESGLGFLPLMTVLLSAGQAVF